MLSVTDLDHVIWTALTTGHAALAEGDERARRYPDPIAPFAAVRDNSEAAWRSLARLIPPDGSAVLFTPEEVTPTGLTVTDREMIDQMIGPALAPPTIAFTELGAADAPAMVELATLTQPGPFKLRTHELGRYIGIYDRGTLVALSGERMHPVGFTEVSAVCVHPDARGKGYAAELIRAVVQQIVARGETPMLHVRPANTSAIALYLKLGFVKRTQLHLAVVAATPARSTP